MNRDVIQFLIDQGANLKAITLWGETATHYAALHGTPAALECLIDEGCPVGKPCCKITILTASMNKILTLMFGSCYRQITLPAFWTRRR